MEAQPPPLLSRQGHSREASAKFEGPYWITDALGPHTVAADQLKPCHSEQPGKIETGASNAPVEESVVEEGTRPGPTPADEPPAQPAINPRTIIRDSGSVPYHPPPITITSYSHLVPLSLFQMLEIPEEALENQPAGVLNPHEYRVRP